MPRLQWESVAYEREDCESEEEIPMHAVFRHVCVVICGKCACETLRMREYA
jgi:hypothetical protein